jgi:hypothetical protein
MHLQLTSTSAAPSSPIQLGHLQTDTVNINSQLYDWYDDSNRARLIYFPYLQDPDPNAPVPPPLNLRGNRNGAAAILSWNAIPSTNTVYRYKLYYGTWPGFPYIGKGLPQGDSPIDVGNTSNYTLSGLGNGTYYFAITAYDTLGRESWYSNEADSRWRAYLPIVLRN